MAEKPLITDEIRASAVDLIRALASKAGDMEQIRDVLAAHAKAVGQGRAVTDCLAALVLTYSECISRPTPLGLSPSIRVNVPRKATK